MPASRFFGYYDYMIEQNKSPDQLMEEVKAREMEKADWDEEVKRARRRAENDRKKTKHSDTIQD